MEMKDFIYANKNLDPESCPIEDLENEVKRLKDLSGYFDSKQDGEKNFINAVYGAIANSYFIGHILDVAESITLQGQDLNHYSENKVNEYFSGVFQNDTNLHKELGIDTEIAKKFNISLGRTTDNGPVPNTPEYAHIIGNQTLTVAGDTDSIYVEFGRLVKYFNIPEDRQTQFVVDLWFKGCEPFMKNAYEEYAKAFNCPKNVENLELEKICRTAILYAKKHYAMEETWSEPGYFLPDMEEIVYKGLEVIQGSTPPYARKCQKDMIEYVLRCYIKDERPSYQSLIDKLKKYKAEMKAQPVDEIAKGASIGDYEKGVLDDKQRVVFGEHCPIHVKGAGFYNNILLNKKKYLAKYSRLRTGDKCKFYYTTNPLMEVFAFAPGSYPVEFAPGVDYEKQFDKTILTPLNRLIEVIGYEPLSTNLCYAEELF